MRCEEEEEKKREKPIFCAIYPIYIKYIRFQSIKIKKITWLPYIFNALSIPPQRKYLLFSRNLGYTHFFLSQMISQ